MKRVIIAAALILSACANLGPQGSYDDQITGDYDDWHYKIFPQAGRPGVYAVNWGTNWGSSERADPFLVKARIRKAMKVLAHCTVTDIEFLTEWEAFGRGTVECN